MASEPRSSFARRRASWGRVEPGQDPLHIDIEHPQPPKSSWRLDDDPFASPMDERPYGHEMSYRDTRTRYENATGSYQTAQAGPSSVSLISEFRGSGDTLDGQREDDEARLTSNMDKTGVGGVGWALSDEDDPERSVGGSARSRRRASRYGASPSPLKKTGNTLKLMTGNLRRASIRVVNFAGFGLEDHVRLADAEDESPEHTLVDKVQADDTGEEEEVASLPDLSRSLPIRGRTLGCLGSTSRIRMAMYRFLVYP